MKSCTFFLLDCIMDQSHIIYKKKNLSNATDTNYFTTILQIVDVAKLLLVFISAHN